MDIGRLPGSPQVFHTLVPCKARSSLASCTIDFPSSYRRPVQVLRINVHWLLAPPILKTKFIEPGPNSCCHGGLTWKPGRRQLRFSEFISEKTGNGRATVCIKSSSAMCPKSRAVQLDILRRKATAKPPFKLKQLCFRPRL